MNAEGIGVVITSEWLQATATGIPLLGLAWLLVKGLGSFWRQTVVEARGADLEELRERLVGRVEATRFGWVVVGDKVKVVFSGGFFGEQTFIERGRPDGKELVQLDYWASATTVLEHLEGLGTPSGDR